VLGEGFAQTEEACRHAQAPALGIVNRGRDRILEDHERVPQLASPSCRRFKGLCRLILLVHGIASGWRAVARPW
jgi:hypothetical protein